MADSSINMNIYDRQITYLKKLLSQLNTIVPAKERHRYHLIFRDQIFESYDTLAECLKGYKKHSKYICCVKYYPLGSMVTKIQALWRGYHQRRVGDELIKIVIFESMNNTYMNNTYMNNTQLFETPFPDKETVNKISNI